MGVSSDNHALTDGKCIRRNFAGLSLHPYSGLDCNKFRRDIIETVEAHSRPDRNSPVVAIFKGGTTSALVQDNIPRKWDFFVLQCKVIRNPDESLSCARDDGGLEVRE